MLLYECKICNFNSKIKSHYLNHLNTKKHNSRLKKLVESEKKEHDKKMNDTIVNLGELNTVSDIDIKLETSKKINSYDVLDKKKMYK